MVEKGDETGRVCKPSVRVACLDNPARPSVGRYRDQVVIVTSLGPTENLSRTLFCGVQLRRRKKSGEVILLQTMTRLVAQGEIVATAVLLRMSSCYWAGVQGTACIHHHPVHGQVVPTLKDAEPVHSCTYCALVWFGWAVKSQCVISFFGRAMLGRIYKYNERGCVT